jgi:hypothetical protein
MAVIDFIIGLPPNNLIEDTNTLIKNSMPLCRIYPGIPSFTEGITLFQRVSAFKSEGKNKNTLSYLDLLKNQGFTLNQFSNQMSQGCLLVAYQADSFPTDSFTNEYGENFLQSFTDVASEKAASLMQIMGARNVGQAVNQLKVGLERGGGTVGKGIAQGLDVAQKTAENILSSIPGASSSANLISALAAGSRIDFPMLWKSSGFQPSYTMTIRLYNPNPGSDESTRKYIIGPLAALMLLGIPVSQDGKTYSWPFIHKIQSPGIYDLDPAFISNITVIKGGDQQQISYKQKLGIVDVRIDFGSLFNSILAGRDSSGRPTLKSYLRGMENSKSGVKKFSSTGLTKLEIESGRGALLSTLYSKLTKNKAPTVTELTNEEKQNPPNRISTTIKDAADYLSDLIPRGLKI